MNRPGIHHARRVAERERLEREMLEISEREQRRIGQDLHVRNIVIQAGVPVGDKGCKPNSSITFTPEPQMLLDNIRAKNSYALGYHGATTVSDPVQDWYAMGITDIRGRTFQDGEVFTNFEQPEGLGPF